MRLSFWREQFEWKADAPGSWVLQARRLKRAADTVFNAHSSDLQRLQAGADPLHLEHLESSGPASLLYGLALENLLKALVIESTGSRIVKWKLLPWRGTGHGLVELAREANVPLIEVEIDLMSRLTCYVEWAGRYPIPKAVSQMAIKQRNISPKVLPLPLQVGELSSLNDLYKRLEDSVLA